jgi:hypothetical protein
LDDKAQAQGTAKGSMGFDAGKHLEIGQKRKSKWTRDVADKG